MDKKSNKKEDEIVNTVVERYCTVRESLIESCKEMKLIREGKLPKKTWKQLKEEIKEMKKQEEI